MENEEEIKEGVKKEDNLDLSWVKGAVEKLHSNSDETQGKSNDETSESDNELSGKADTLTAEQPVDDQPKADEEEVGAEKTRVPEPAPERTEETQGVGEEVLDEQKPIEEEKKFTQSQVNKLMGQAREEGRNSALKNLLAKYGVETDSELDDMFGKGQTYDQLNADYLDLGNTNKNVMAENALLKTGISPDRWEDVKLILTGKGLEVSEQSISEHLATHPEWKSSVGNEPKVLTKDDMEQKVINRGATVQNNVTPSVPRQLGGEVNDVSTEDTVAFREKLDKIFGM